MRGVPSFAGPARMAGEIPDMSCWKRRLFIQDHIQPFRERNVSESIELKFMPSGPASSMQVRKLKPGDVVGSLRSGWDDFRAYPSYSIMLAIIYPIVGLLIARVLHGYSFLPLLFPLSAGFALLGPFAAIVFYDLSWQRERGRIPSAAAAMDIIRSTSSTAIGLLCAMLAVLFLTWVATAQSIYNAFFGFAPVFSMSEFFERVIGTVEGHRSNGA